MLYSIFMVCVVGTQNCTKLYAEMPAPFGLAIEEEQMRKECLANNKDDHAFDAPVFNPQGQKVKITPSDCVIGKAPPAGMAPANQFIGYHE